MGVRRNFPRGGQHRHFACPFQVADDAMQMDVHETHYVFYALKAVPHVMGVGRGAGRGQAPLDFEI